MNPPTARIDFHPRVLRRGSQEEIERSHRLINRQAIQAGFSTATIFRDVKDIASISIILFR